MRIKDIAGQRFGRLVAERPLEARTDGRIRWECRCDCGGTAAVIGKSLRSNLTKSCGCLMREAQQRRVERQCVICGDLFEARAAGSRQPYCEACRQPIDAKKRLVWSRNNHAANRAKDRASGRRWRSAHPEKVKTMQRAWRLANRQKVNENARRWRVKHPERAKATSERYNAANREGRSAATKKWMIANPERVREGMRIRAARKRGSAIRKITTKELNELLAAQNGQCFYCIAQLDHTRHLDHKTPLARGGAHALDNVAWACAPCNLRKHTKTAEEFMGSPA